MNAIEYVKKNGIEKSKIHLDRMKQERWINSFFNDLKQIVDAFELVEKVGGLDNAKTFDESCMYCIAHLTTLGNLQKAVKLMEQCQ